jgi:hypothetical protein
MQPIFCPHCGGEFQVSNNAVGHNAPCPYCDRSLFIPEPPETNVEPIPFSSFPAQNRMQPGTRFGLALIGFCLIGGIILGLVALAHQSALSESERRASAPAPAPPSRNIQPSYHPPEPSSTNREEEVAFLGLSAFFSWLLLLAAAGLLAIVTQILILIWVVKDARARGSDGAAWLIVILLAHVVGLLVYLASRPSGPLVHCHNCGNRRLDYLRACPVCQHVDQPNANVSFTTNL